MAACTKVMASSGQYGFAMTTGPAARPTNVASTAATRFVPVGPNRARAVPALPGPTTAVGGAYE